MARRLPRGRKPVIAAIVGTAVALSACGGGGSGQGGPPPPAASPEKPAETACNDGSDNDGDGFVDCADIDCRIAGGACVLAPPLDRTVASTIRESAAFLYTGDDPLQKDADAGAFDLRRLSLVRGKVVDRTGAPLPGVRVSVRGHAEHGYTLTRPDGVFDLAVNGGGRLIFHYEKDGFLAADRATAPGWQRQERVPDVGLLEEGKATTAIAANSDHAQILSGDKVKDPLGSHQPLAILSPGTMATAELPNGEGKALTSLTVHVTEYPLDSGTSRFSPGTPPTSDGVTYGMGFTVDEAKALSGNRVSFSKPVSLYVENLLGLPVGTPVPMGYYDATTAEWEPEPAGRVVKVLDIANGAATLDVDGDGTAESDTALAVLGVAPEELAVLAARYSAGTTLWRTAVNHFSTHQAVFNVTPPAGALPPTITGTSLRPLDVPSRRGNALVEPQAVGQGIGVAGTPYSLYYQSNRALPYGAGFKLEVPVVGTTVPKALRGVHVHVDIAGQTYDQDLPAAVNASLSYLWDGKDGFGRVMQGQTKATVTVEYHYEGALAASDVLGVAGSGGRSTYENTRFVVPDAVLATSFEVVLGVWDASGFDLGGFGLDVLHAYDPASQTVFFGWGDQRRAENVALTVKQPAKGFAFGSPDGVVVAPDGSVIVTDDAQFDTRATGRLLKVDPQGKATVLAGPGASGAAGTLDLGAPQGVVMKFDGTVIYADYLNDAVRAVNPDGSFETLIGDLDSDHPLVNETLDYLDGLALGPREELYLANNDKVYRFEGGQLVVVAGGGSSSDEGVPATRANITRAGGLAVDPDGSVFVVDRGIDGVDGGHRVRKVTPDGTIHTVAGKGSPGFSGDGGQATDAELDGPRGIALGPDGTLFIADQGNNRIRKVTTDGVISTILGDSDAKLEGGQLASKTAIDEPDGIAVGPDGTVYIAGKTALYAVGNSLPAIGATDTVIPSADGHTLYRFDSRGKHRATLDAVTGIQELAFAYDDKGHLTSITDSDGLVTTLHRDSGGIPDSLVAPFQQKTRLEIAGGLLKAVRDDLNRTVTLEYDNARLLKRVVDPKKGGTTFLYDPTGRLGSVTDPTGYKETFSASATATKTGIGYGVTVTTSEGRSTEYSVAQGAAAALDRGVRLPTDHTVTWSDAFVSRTETAPDKTTTTALLDADPNFGAQTLLPSDITVTTPGGRSLTARPLRTKRLSNLSDALSVDEWDELVEINGRISETVYTRADRTITTTTPTGRHTTTILDDHGRTTDVTVPSLAPVHYDYDDQGRVTTVTQKSGKESRVQKMTYGSDGLLATETDPLKHTVKLARDAGGRVQSVTLPDLNLVAWSLDDNDNVVSLTPPGRKPHTFDYEPDNLLKLATPPTVPDNAGKPNPSIGVTAFHYDADRQVSRIDHSDGRPIVLDYDAKTGRPKSTKLEGVTQTYGYDATSGALTSIKRSDGVTVGLTFDGPLWTATKWSGGQMQGSVKADYDDNFWLSSLTVNDASTVKFSYDDDGLLTGASGNGGALTIDRDKATGMVTGTTLGMVTTAQGFNGFGELANLSASFQGSAGFSQALERDALGRITHIAESVDGTTHELGYSYDERGRLVEIDRDGTITDYAYDPNGNRTSVTIDGVETVAADYDEQDRILSYGTATYEQTAQGDLLRKTDGAGTTELTYDELGNLRKAIVSDGSKTKTLQYFVDGFGRRVARNDGGRVTQWLYRDALRPVSEVNPDGVFTHFVYASGDSAPDFLLRSGVPYRVVKDHLGSVRLVVNALTGAVAQELEYDEFGRVLRDTAPGFQPFGFAGGLHDADTGLVRFGARDYDAETGRWTAKDPKGFGGGRENIYEYAGADPVNRLDPTGLTEIVPTDFVGPLRADQRRGLSCEQKGALQELLARERKYGSHKAARMSTILFGDGLLIPFMSSLGITVPSPYGPMDLDWFATVRAVNYGGRYTALFVYAGAKSGWSMGRFIKGSPIGHALPFADPSEFNAFMALLEDLWFVNIFDKQFFRDYRPSRQCE